MPERLKSLPAFTCVDDDGGKTNLWPDAGPVSYAEGNEVGRNRAAQLVDVVRETQSPSLLGHVMEAIAKGGRFGGVEVGFFHAVSLELMTPHVLTEFVAVPPERQFRVGRKVGHLVVVHDNDKDEATESAVATAAA